MPREKCLKKMGVVMYYTAYVTVNFKVEQIILRLRIITMPRDKIVY